MDNADIESRAIPDSPRRRCLEGFSSFSHFIAEDRQEAIYHRLGSLSARNLLYQQGELHYLEHELEVYDKEDAQDLDNVPAQQRARLWDYHAVDGSDSILLRRELRIRSKTA